MTNLPKLRCALYTRKSSEEGLDQEFNSLDAQREACAAFVASQVGLGWKLVVDRYDDGGISGGTMERPALQRLLQDIRDCKVDVVVVYKIDRLTRSLMDFSRIVEIFDSHGVSFVSVTQQFNTTTSMGRLTLNVLLSFAQFEREVTAERIRDKIAASKRKGMWMGGTVPLGYEVKNRKLLVKPDAATEVRHIFGRYLELRSVPALLEEMRKSAARRVDAKDVSAWPDIGSVLASRTVHTGKLYYILANPLYVGKIRQGGQLFPGEHEAIIEQEMFDRAQALLAEQAPRLKGIPTRKDTHLLTGLLFDESGDRMSPIHANKQGRRYQYYISTRLLKGGNREDRSGWRLPASEIEQAVVHQLRSVLSDRVTLAGWIGEHSSQQQVAEGLSKADKMIAHTAGDSPDLLRTMIRIAFRRITLSACSISFDTHPASFARWLASSSGAADDVPSSQALRVTSRRRAQKVSNSTPNLTTEAVQTFVLPIALKRRGIGARLIVENGSAPVRKPDQQLVTAIARAHAYLDKLTDGARRDRLQVAELFGVHKEDVSRFLPLAFLSPQLVEAIMHGRQRVDLSISDLVRGIDLPLSWTAQANLLA